MKDRDGLKHRETKEIEACLNYILKHYLGSSEQEAQILMKESLRNEISYIEKRVFLFLFICCLKYMYFSMLQNDIFFINICCYIFLSLSLLVLSCCSLNLFLLEKHTSSFKNTMLSEFLASDTSLFYL